LWQARARAEAVQRSLAKAAARRQAWVVAVSQRSAAGARGARRRARGSLLAVTFRLYLRTLRNLSSKNGIFFFLRQLLGLF